MNQVRFNPLAETVTTSQTGFLNSYGRPRDLDNWISFIWQQVTRPTLRNCAAATTPVLARVNCQWKKSESVDTAATSRLLDKDRIH